MASVQYQKNSTQNTIIVGRSYIQEIRLFIVKLAERREASLTSSDGPSLDEHIRPVLYALTHDTKYNHRVNYKPAQNKCCGHNFLLLQGG
jgi:hypothetical protein